MTRSLPDLCDDHADLVQVAEPVFRDFGATRAFHGPITTIKCHEDNALVRAAFETPGEGRVLVVDGGGSLRRALVGDKLGSLMLKNGWAGVVVSGAVRDVEVLATMPVAVRALGVIPVPPQKKGLGERDVPVRFAGVTFTPGHWLYADENGLLVSATPLA
jgi:regulator of ribonuclease activity A